MANKMLIDATHPEETRVVVVRGNRVEEFDFESAAKKQLRGNIYLAKVTRVEPSLQAAFVEYGGNRHGFLAFSEIHPDYYQIPVADRQALIEAEAEEVRQERERHEKHAAHEEAEAEGESETEGEAETAAPSANGEASEAAAAETHSDEAAAPRPRSADADDEEEHVESVGAEDALEEVPERRKPRARQYKIQEVIKRRQVMLVQVVKEERGNKGAALTTYLSLAGRYSVLMPNTGRGGGISRKITTPADRKRLKTIASELDVPEGMGVILRTAGASRTKAEIKRDFEYLLRLWENVRDLTLKSSAPTLVYEEGSLVKRSIRDLYNKDIDEVLVAGDEAYREAKDFMRMLMPSHARNVKPYRENQPIFGRFGVESQLDAMFSPQVTLRSGGYIVINQTEALVSIDVNSGRSTREHNIEDTALQTNLEAAEEIARQLRLRDLAGLIVIDFIDMEESRNNKAVERKLKDCLKNDRARIQVGRISHFGLMEMSRQRIRTGVLEGSTQVCPHCLGAGIVRSVESVALHVLRSLEDALLKGVTHNLTIRTRTAVALYILNQKRAHLGEIEARFGLAVAIAADEALGSQHFVIDRGEPITAPPPPPVARIAPDTVVIDEEEPVLVEVEESEAEAEERESQGTEENRDEAGRNGGKRRRRRRRRRNGESLHASAGHEFEDGEAAEEHEAEDESETTGAAEEAESGESAADEDAAHESAEETRRRRRRGRRGGRRGRSGEARENGAEPDSGAGDEDLSAEEGDAGSAEHAVQALNGAGADEDERPLANGVTDSFPADSAEAADDIAADEAEPSPLEAEPSAWPQLAPESEMAAPTPDAPAASDRTEPVAEPRTVLPVVAAADAGVEAAAAPQPKPVQPEPEPEPDRPKRVGWWQRRSFF